MQALKSHLRLYKDCWTWHFCQFSLEKPDSGIPLFYPFTGALALVLFFVWMLMRIPDFNFWVSEGIPRALAAAFSWQGMGKVEGESSWREECCGRCKGRAWPSPAALLHISSSACSQSWRGAVYDIPVNALSLAILQGPAITSGLTEHLRGFLPWDFGWCASTAKGQQGLTPY